MALIDKFRESTTVRLGRILFMYLFICLLYNIQIYNSARLQLIGGYMYAQEYNIIMYSWYTEGPLATFAIGLSSKIIVII